jgi:hypothetical protein
MREQTRRRLIGRGAAVVTTLLGASILGRRSGPSASTSIVPAAAASSLAQDAGPVVEIRLYGQGWQMQSDAPRATWARPARGQQSLVFGELFDAPADAGGSKVGELYATCTCVNSPFGPGPLSATLLEQHTLNLQDGTLTGIGTSQDDEGVFAIVGGTGRFAGARGSYTARQSPIGRGGDGTAELVISVTLDGTA